MAPFDAETAHVDFFYFFQGYDLISEQEYQTHRVFFFKKCFVGQPV